VWKYEGDGAWLPGIPAQDISDEEAHERGIEADLKASSIYRRVSDRPEKPEKVEGDR
jgi:hypothetical protein